MQKRKLMARHLKHNLPAARWQHIHDPRARKGRRYELPALLQLMVVGLCVSTPTLRDLENLAKDLCVRRALGIRGTPSDTTLERIIGLLTPEPLRVMLRAFNCEAWRSKKYPLHPKLNLHLTAIDGKAMATDSVVKHPASQPQGPGGKSGPYILRAMRACLVSAPAQPILDQMMIPADAGEPDTFLEFFQAVFNAYSHLGLLECISVDAGFTSRENLHGIAQAGTSFIAGLKGNQPTLYQRAIELLGDEETDPVGGWEEQYTEAQGYKVVTRWFARSCEMVDFHGYTCLTQVWRVLQCVESPDGTRTWEDRYFLTNLPWERLSALECLWAIRLHWGIENGPNWTMDTQWKEDQRAWVRKGLGLEVLGLLRALAYNILQLLRTRAFRSSSNRAMSWRRLFEVLRMSLTTPGVLGAPTLGFT